MIRVIAAAAFAALTAPPVLTAAQPPRTAVCFNGAMPGHADRLLDPNVSTPCWRSQRELIHRLDPNAQIFAVVSPCGPPQYCDWKNNQCTKVQRKCVNLTAWRQAVAPNATVSTYNAGVDNALPADGNGCDAWPPKDSRFYYQYWGHRRCLDMVEAQEKQTGHRFDAVVHIRPDDCVTGVAYLERICRIPDCLHQAGNESAVMVIKMKRLPLACTDYFGVVPRRRAGVYFNAIGQYYQCASAEAWESYFHPGYERFFQEHTALGEIILGKQLHEHRVPWRVMHA